MPLYIGNTTTITALILDVDAVNIYISRDAGATWDNIATNVAISHATVNDQEIYDPLAYEWVVTAPASDLCKFRITNAADDSLIDDSDVVFKIKNKGKPYVVKTADVALSLMHQPDCSIPGSEIVFTDGIYIPHHKNTACICRSAELAPEATAGVLAVHLVNDPDGRIYLLPLTDGNETKRRFDTIYETGTTVDTAEVTLFPGP